MNTKILVLVASLFLVFVGCTNPALDTSTTAITTKALVINGSTGTKITSGARSLTGVIGSTNGVKVVAQTNAEYTEMIGRSSAPLLSGVAEVSPINDGDVFEYATFGTTVTVTVTATYDTDGVTVASVKYTGLFNDGYSGFTVITTGSTFFTATEEILVRVEDGNDNVLSYHYLKSNLTGSLREGGGFDAIGFSSQVRSDSWLLYNSPDANTGLLNVMYNDVTVKAGPNGIAVLNHMSRECISGTWTPLTLDASSVAYYQTLVDHAQAYNNWGYNGCYQPTNGLWTGFSGNAATVQAQYASLNY